ncbi:DUF6542 domain-containing protein [Pseudonocardia acidicola]|uniref:DUF6542 domain-containing protein n=1 Tax=Pseudonocardia acidicola TaxID=2724939 RepID=A0ABX1SAG3_9PSEU|nr:DUF6542 domain-containing protein [Pseudonocardia acidicola]NMH98555.1 hypothetical protein [Pseudonocardia acidicola]
MTASRGAASGQKRQPASSGRWPVSERSILGTVLGIPPLAAVGVALAFTALGVLVDILRLGTLGTIFKICYFAGCVLAVAWVRRRNLFGPMVQPPLLIAVAVPVVVLLVGSPGPGAGITQKLLVIGAPLINAFPTMAVTTGVVVALGAARLLLQRGDRRGRPAARPGGNRTPRGSARGGGSGATGRGRSAGTGRGGSATGRGGGTGRGGTGSGRTGGTRDTSTRGGPRDAPREAVPHGSGARGPGGAGATRNPGRGGDPGYGSPRTGAPRAGGSTGQRGSDAARGAGRTSAFPPRY